MNVEKLEQQNEALIGGSVLNAGLGGDATADECIELAEALERLRAVKIVEAVASLPIGGAKSVMPTPFQAGYQLACEEIKHRIQTEEWELNLPPNAGANSVAEGDPMEAEGRNES